MPNPPKICEKKLFSIKTPGKKVEGWEIKTPAGTTQVKQTSNDLGIATEYQTKLNPKAANLVETITARIMKAKTKSLNTYAQGYLDGFGTSLNLYGADGLRTQLIYFLSNVRDKALSVEVKKMIAELKE